MKYYIRIYIKAKTMVFNSCIKHKPGLLQKNRVEHLDCARTKWRGVISELKHFINSPKLENGGANTAFKYPFLKIPEVSN